MGNGTSRKRADMTDDEVPQNGKSQIQRTAFPALGEAISFWSAIASPLTGVIIGFPGAWFYTWQAG